MERRQFLGMALGSLVIGPPRALAQRAPRIWRIGILSFGSGFTASSATGSSDSRSAVLIRAFREQGYVEGKNVVYVARNAGGRIERLPELAAEVAGAGVDVIVTTGSEATRAAKQATATIPIVFLGPSYPVEEGLVASFARPGGTSRGSRSRIRTSCPSCSSCCATSRRSSQRRPLFGIPTTRAMLSSCET